MILTPLKTSEANEVKFASAFWYCRDEAFSFEIKRVDPATKIATAPTIARVSRHDMHSISATPITT